MQFMIHFFFSTCSMAIKHISYFLFAESSCVSSEQSVHLYLLHIMYQFGVILVINLDHSTSIPPTAL